MLGLLTFLLVSLSPPPDQAATEPVDLTARIPIVVRRRA